MSRKKNSKKSLGQNTELRVLSIRINSDKIEKEIKNALYTYRHFENILLLLIKENYEKYSQGLDTENDFKHFTNKQTLRNALLDYKSKNSVNSDYLKEKYKDNQLWQSLSEVARKIKQHNFGYIIDRVKANYKTYFTNIKTYKENPGLFAGTPKPPKPKKLSKMIEYAIELDKYTALSFAKLEKQNLIGINLTNHMIYIYCNQEQIKKLTEIDKLYSARVVYDNGMLYLQISYLKKINKQKQSQINKLAGIDIGVNNIAAIFIDDRTTPSLVIDGKPHKHYNSRFNRLVAKLNESKSQEVLEWKESKTGSKYPSRYTEKGKRIGRFISFLYAKRNRYFQDQFHKIAKRIVEYLTLNGVSTLYISKNTAELKNNGECNLNKAVKQNFIQIPFIKLLKYIEYKAQEKGIQVYYVDEKYTSKASCISDNVKSIQDNPDLANAFKGKRVKRGLFLDTAINKIFNADVNGAVNHIKVATGKCFIWLKDKLFKLANPIKIKSDYEFCKLIKNLQNSVSGKSISLMDIESSYSNRMVANAIFC